MIKVRLTKLGKKQVDLVDALRKNGFPHMQSSTLSLCINGRLNTPQAEAVLDECNKIIESWEHSGKEKE